MCFSVKKITWKILKTHLQSVVSVLLTSRIFIVSGHEYPWPWQHLRDPTHICGLYREQGNKVVMLTIMFVGCIFA